MSSADQLDSPRHGRLGCELKPFGIIITSSKYHSEGWQAVHPRVCLHGSRLWWAWDMTEEPASYVKTGGAASLTLVGRVLLPEDSLSRPNICEL